MSAESERDERWLDLLRADVELDRLLRAIAESCSDSSPPSQASADACADHVESVIAELGYRGVDRIDFLLTVARYSVTRLQFWWDWNTGKGWPN